MVRGAALDGRGDDLPALLLGLVLQLLLDLLDLHGGLVANLVLNALQQVFLGLFLGQPGEFFQGFQLLIPDFVGLGLGLGGLGKAPPQFLFLPFEGFGFLVQSGFLLLQTPFLLAQLGAALFHFFLVFRARFMDFVLGFQKHFLLPVFACADGFVNQPGSFGFGGADLPLSDLLAVDKAQTKAQRQRCKHSDDNQNNFQQSHKLAAHLLLKK